MPGVLVAGIGNIFLGDDAFGVEVVRRLSAEEVPPGVSVRDFGIRGLHLAFDLLDANYDLVILVDAAPRGGKPGTVYLIEPELSESTSPSDAHSMTPDAVLNSLRALGGKPGAIRIVGCEPENVEEGMGLSAPVEGAIGEAVKLIRELIAREAVASNG
jgi:hydrogenase maturation protease